MQEEKTDKELIKSFLNEEDGGSFEILIKKYLKDVYSFTYHFSNNKAEAEDITQETFVKVWKNIKKFYCCADYSKSSFEDIKKI